MDPTLQNAMMLQAIKAGGQHQMQPPAGTSAAMGSTPMTPPTPMPMPADPASQAGSMGAQMQQMPGMGAGVPPGMMQQNPIAAALMSAIPGGGQ